MTNINETKSRIAVGNATVYLILAVSLGATLAYWYVLSGIENAKNLSQFWQVIIWLVVAVGLVAEIIKKVTLSTFRNKKIWLTATFVSVVTVMGTYSILDQTRQNDFTKQSDNYQDSRASKQAADSLSSKYAYASGYHLEILEKQYDQVIVDRDNRKIKYNTYLKRKAALEQKINAKRAYDSAVATSKTSQTNMSNGSATGSSANPLLSNIAGVLNGSEELIKTLFYLLVTILLEISAFWIGGQVQELKNLLHLTEVELLDLKNQEIFGFSMREVQRDLFERVKRSQQDVVEAEKEVSHIRKTRKDPVNRQTLTVGEAGKMAKETRQQADTNQIEARAEYSPPLPSENGKIPFGFVPHDTVPKQVQSVPKQVQNVPKKVQPKSVSIGSTIGGGTGAKRKQETPDTGTRGTNAHRYNALLESIKKGGTKTTHRGIKAFKYGGRGMGDSTAKIYKKALKRDGIIS